MGRHVVSGPANESASPLCLGDCLRDRCILGDVPVSFIKEPSLEEYRRKTHSTDLPGLTRSRVSAELNRPEKANTTNRSHSGR